MIKILPVSDLRNKFPEVEKAVSDDEPVYLTKNGHGVMVIMSLPAYERLVSKNTDYSKGMLVAEPEKKYKKTESAGDK